MSTKDDELLNELAVQEYKYGFTTDIEMDVAPAGLNEDTIRFISAKKNEPDWLLEWRLKAFRVFQEMKMPEWQNFKMPDVDFQSISYWASPKEKPKLNSLDEVDPELLDTFKKLGIPLDEQKVLAGVVAVDAVFDSVSVKTTFQEKLKEKGVIFGPISEAVKSHPELVKKYLGTVVPQTDNIYAALNRSEEHTSELQSRPHLVCRLLLEKKKKN